MKNTTACLLLLIAFTACNHKPEKTNKLAMAEWLIGTWENKTELGKLSESWEKTNDSVLIGHSYFIKAKDTLHFESIELKQRRDDLFYIPTVRGQNDDKPVEFVLTSSTPKQMTFANALHDYPQKIVYNQINNDSLVATISGVQQGKPSTKSYPMKRMK